MPLYFIANQGQMDARVAYYVQAGDQAAGASRTLYFTPDGLTLALDSGERREGPASGGSRYVLNLEFVGANRVTPVGQDLTGATVSYFTGPRDEWRAGVPTYARLVYPDLWPGIDLVYHGTASRLKYEFLVRPGADPAVIRLAYHGATLRLNAAGQLEVTTPLGYRGSPAGSLTDEAPVAYQDVAGRRVPVAAAYALDEATYGFRLGSYDRTRPLVIDPAVLLYGTYLGGSEGDWAQGIAVDREGNVYVTGYTWSTEASFPVKVGPDPTFNGGNDAYVAKLNARGTALLYLGYIGGSGEDVATGIAVDIAGNAYVTGFTGSTEATFPVTVGPDLTYNGSNWDAFVAKVNRAGSALVYAGYVGGDSYDRGEGIAVDRAGNAYITGYTKSDQSTFPVLVGPDLTINFGENPLSDAFVAKVNAGGATLAYAGYIGGHGPEEAYAIAVDRSGSAYVTGKTNTTNGTFPVIGGPDLGFNGAYDAFVTKVDPSGAAFLYSGYIGGDYDDIGFDIAVDRTGSAYIAGETNSTQSTFPLKVGPDLSRNGYHDAFVARVQSDGLDLEYCGYIGGADTDAAYGIALDMAGHAYVAGYTKSDQTTFPVLQGPDLTINSSQDAFVAKVQAGGAGLDYAGYIGGAGGATAAGGVAVDRAGSAYVVGRTTSTEATFPDGDGWGSVRGADRSHNGGDDAFVVKVSDRDPGDEYWYTVDIGTDGPVYALAVGEDDSVYAGGFFEQAGGLAAPNIARWDVPTDSWLDIGGGLDLPVHALTWDGNELYAGGEFAAAGAVPVARIARWDGTQWAGLGTGATDTVEALVPDGHGGLYAGGLFTTIGGVGANYVAHWDGANWAALGGGLGGPVLALAVDAGGNLYAGGEFTTAGGDGASYVARWDGTSWWPLGSGVNGVVRALTLNGGGSLYAGGDFTTAGGSSAAHVARWDGAQWSALGDGLPGSGVTVSALAWRRNGELYAGGDFLTVDGATLNHIARWDGRAWSAVGTGMDAPVRALAVDGSNNLYAGGDFFYAGGLEVNHVAMWWGLPDIYEQYLPLVVR